mmetsp:Transcript_17579/g.40830  ORF Transcript_17579/g.40830 Transcript_17579/m.40830 type:complete len:128 (+) Transcript_17579:625-1008(+)
MFGEIKPTFSLAGDEQIAARKALLLEGGGLAKQWAHIENQLKASTTPFLVGTKLTIADVVVFSMAAQLASGWLDGIDSSFLNKYPRVKEHKAMIASLPQVRKFYAEMPVVTKEAWAAASIDIRAFTQ